MQRWCGLIAVVSTALLLSLTSHASAQLLLATPPGGSGIEHVELAYANGDGEPVTWIALRLSGEPAALVAALPEGARAELAPDAWLEALELTASPRVLLPRGQDDCGESPGFLEVKLPRGRGIEPDARELASLTEVNAALAEYGLTPSAPLPAADKYLLWIFAPSGASVTTRTLRVSGGQEPLAFVPGRRVTIALSAVTRGPAQLEGETAAAGALDVTFVTGPNRSHDYLERARAWTEEHDVPLLEARSQALLFDWAIHADLVTVAPLLRSYASRAAGDEAGAERCASALLELRTNPDFAAARAACGSAGDAVLALEAAGSDLATLQRFYLDRSAPISAFDFSPGGEPKAPIVRAALVDDAACPRRAPADPIVIGQPTPIEGGARPRDDDAETVVTEEHYHDVGCSGGAYVESDQAPVGEADDDDESECEDEAPEDGECDSADDYHDETCSADTSSTSTSTSESCSSDTSSASSEDDCSGDSSGASSGDDCSSDSSGSSSDASDDSCSSDSGAATDDDGCAGSSAESSSGYDGDTCAGSAAPERTERSAASLRGERRQRPQRVKLSLWSVALAALVLPIRRRKRAP